jgi:hypothetical protein
MSGPVRLAWGRALGNVLGRYGLPTFALKRGQMVHRFG